jgi:hypothetical protein
MRSRHGAARCNTTTPLLDGAIIKTDDNHVTGVRLEATHPSSASVTQLLPSQSDNHVVLSQVWETQIAQGSDSYSDGISLETTPEQEQLFIVVDELPDYGT